MSIPRKQLVILLACGAVLVTVALGVSSAATDCPRGLVNDPYPGRCGLYVDENADGYCDLSQETAAEEQGGKATPIAQDGSVVVSRQPASDVPVVKTSKPIDYHLLSCTLILVSAYVGSLILVKRRVITVFANHLLWNLVLLVSFVVTAVTSLALLLAVTGVWRSPNLSVWRYWHIEAGYIMIIVSLYHVLWHGAYWRCYFRRRPHIPCPDVTGNNHSDRA